eukprot:evm.model.scf_1966.1 EVM.evm.TU.scf_1966.1   scf_1966:724-5250(+)
MAPCQWEGLLGGGVGLGRLAAVEVSSIVARGQCGNGLCEWGEGPDTRCAASDPACRERGCAQDCPFPWIPCPEAPADNGQLAACSGRGKCYHASGKCDCYTGYTGDKCDKCASGWIRFGHRCAKLSIPYGVLINPDSEEGFVRPPEAGSGTGEDAEDEADQVASKDITKPVILAVSISTSAGGVALLTWCWCKRRERRATDNYNKFQSESSFQEELADIASVISNSGLDDALLVRRLSPRRTGAARGLSAVSRMALGECDILIGTETSGPPAANPSQWPAALP